VRYLGLCGWPHPLVFDYGTEPVQLAAQVLPGAAIIAVPLAGTVIGLRRNTAAGFLGAWFFGILAPSSSVVPVVTEIAAEHRMYLPLAAVVGLLAAGLHAWIGRRGVGVCAAVAVAMAFGFLTWRRNEDYRSGKSIWSDTVGKCPGNARAHYNLAGRVFAEGRVADAIHHYEEALRIRPDFASAHSNLANILLQSGALPAALHHAEEAVRLKLTLAEAHSNLGSVLFQQGRTGEALPHYAEAVRLKPDGADLRSNLGSALSQTGRLAEAMTQYEEALRLKPGAAVTHFYLGNTLARLGRTGEARAHYEQALRLEPDFARARQSRAAARAAANAHTGKINPVNRAPIFRRRSSTARFRHREMRKVRVPRTPLHRCALNAFAAGALQFFSRPFFCVRSL
jgi:tetratricopeptide (TPR) repeat protein